MKRKGFLLFLLLSLIEIKRGKSKKEESKEIGQVIRVGRTGVELEMKSTGEALNSISVWAQEIGDRGSSFGEAVAREALVHAKVMNGDWPITAWDEYQRLAAGTGNVDSGDLLLEYGVGASVLNAAKNSVSIAAALNGDANTFRKLIQKKMPQPAADGTTVCHAAALSNCTECLKDIATYVVPSCFEAEAAHGVRPLMTAAAAGQANAVRTLLELGADPIATHTFAGTTALHMAAERGKTLAIQALCQSSMITPFNLLAAAQTTLGGTAVHAAAQKNQHFDVFQALVNDCHADINTATLNGDTSPLYIAANEGFIHSVNALLQLGANPDISLDQRSVSNHNEVSFRSVHSDQYAYSLYLPNQEEANGARPLHAAAERGHTAVAQALINAGADLDGGFSMAGLTPLMLAAQHNQANSIRTLISHGAQIERQAHNAFSGTALSYAAVGGHLDALQTLLDAGANPQTPTRSAGVSPLALAAANGQQNAVEILLSHGADAQQIDNSGLSPLAVASTDAVTKVLLKTDLSTQHKTKAMLDILARGDTQRAAYLLHHTEIELKNESNQALRDVARTGDAYFASQLLKKIEASDYASDALSSLCLAVRYNKNSSHYDLLVVLLDAGIDDPNAICEFTDRSGPRVTPLLLAIEKDDILLARALLSTETEAPGKSADPDLGSPDTNTIYKSPLLTAVVKGRVHIAAALLDAGANCAILVASSKDPSRHDNLLDIARSRRDFDMLQLLSRNGDRCDVSIKDLD
eukprot:CAMPEP_0197305498 /NCGR_PEP_ID=MMETSP0891-20130614/1586_1 /TAXON_ID=44058 ORGANISM="Aureoumbra lagunensis, Strain CCMP1510" /NCGR_SAMPLE_ID=MMETSP0891 /ASSEMBLY_ACC=CAM_ASM_000534 /LENGTH=752 /DNA_ID=CAMNT_0042786587 /DNA_START=490 /DNA_END=2748 /DNA_ORIENTATION=-